MKRREFGKIAMAGALGGGLLRSALGQARFTPAVLSVATEGPERFALDTGYRSTISGPLAVTRDGRVMWINHVPDFGSWYKGAFQIMRDELHESLDSGCTWGPPQVWLPTSTKAFIPSVAEVLQLASRKLLVIGVRYGGYSKDGNPDKSLNEGFTQLSRDDGATWSEPRTLPTGERYIGPGMSSLIQLSSGRVIFPFGYLTKEGHGRTKVSVVYSNDDGETWCRSKTTISLGGQGMESGADEPTMVELPDGRVWMLIRFQRGFQWESISSDGGVTWGPARPSRFPSSSAPAALLRLRSGQIVVVWNASVRHPYARHCLVMAGSDDGGRSFYGFREIAHIEHTVSSPNGWWYVSYPALAEAPDGKVLVAYTDSDWDFNRAKLVRVDPAWLKKSSLVEDFRDGRSNWSRLDAKGDSLASPNDDQPGASLQVEYQKPGPSGMVRNFPLVARGEVRATLTVLKPPAWVMWHDSFLDPGKTDEACLRIRFAEDGQVFVGAGRPRTKAVSQGNEHGPTYSYLAYPVENESVYPGRIKLGERLTLRVRCDVKKREALASIDGGPEVGVPLGNIYGFCYFGIAATEGGAIRIRKLESLERQTVEK